jgi:hypothetical protein
MEQSIRLIGTKKDFENVLGSQGCAERHKPASKKLRMDRNVRVHAQERRRREASQSIQPRKDFVKHNRETGPVPVLRAGGFLAKQMRILADGIHEGTLEQGIAFLAR